jgi:NADP-dependent 3-hydroxy acid dehydrogenase YdfG
MSRLEDKVALVSGAARGIGAAIVKAFIGEGARVWLTEVSVDAGRRLVAQLGRSATFSRLDVREEAD